MIKRCLPLLFLFMLSSTVFAPWAAQVRAAPATQTSEPTQEATPPVDQKQAVAQTPAKAVSEAPPAKKTVADTTPLEANGLTARTLDEFGEWIARLGGQLLLFKHSAAELVQWLKASFSDDAWRQLLFESVYGLLAVFVLGVSAQAAVSRGLRYPRRALAEYAGNVASHMHRLRRSRALKRTSSPPRNSLLLMMRPKPKRRWRLNKKT